MKKLFPFLLAAALLLSLAACGDAESDGTTINITQPTATTTTAEQVSATEDPNGMVLTTAFGETVPTVSTTAFDLASEALTTTFTVPGDDLTIPDVTAPVVVTDVVPTTAPPPRTTLPGLPDLPDDEFGDDDEKTEPSQTGPNGEPLSSDAVEDDTTSETAYDPQNGDMNKLPVYDGQYGYDGKNLTLWFSSDGWDNVKSQKANVKVNYNGKSKRLEGHTVNRNEEAEGPDGYFGFVVDVSSLNTPEHENFYLTIDFPKGAIATWSETQKSCAFTAEVKVTFGEDE